MLNVVRESAVHVVSIQSCTISLRTLYMYIIIVYYAKRHHTKYTQTQKKIKCTQIHNKMIHYQTYKIYIKYTPKTLYRIQSVETVHAKLT